MKTSQIKTGILAAFFWIACGGWFTWIAVAVIGSAVVGAGAAVYEGNQSRQAINKARDQANSFQYQPIDIDALVKRAHDQAITNATDSLALERSLQPGVADARQGYSKTVSDQLKLGGQLSPDTANQVTTAGRVAGGASGIGGSSAPLTASLIGQSSEQLRQTRLNNASQLLSQNQLPVAGLDPGAIASIMLSENNAKNSVAASKLGVNMNAAVATGQANAAEGAGIGSALQSILSYYSKAPTGAGSASTTNPPASSFNTTFNPTFGAFNTPTGLTQGATIGQTSTVGAPFGCWIARAAYGEDSPRWRDFRAWLYSKAPVGFREWYERSGPAIGEWLKAQPQEKAAVRAWMEAQLNAA